MGLRPLRLADWLEPDDRRAADLDAKAALLRTRHDEVVATLPEGDAGSAETLDLVRADLASRGLDVARGGAALHPVDAAGRLVQEDLCVLVRRPEEGWVLAAASVCSPSRWRLADKLGRGLDAIHAPVPGYDRIAGPTRGAFDRLDVAHPVWRTNWTLLEDPEPFQPKPPSTPRAVGPGSPVFLRVERQTLRRLPVSGAVLFTIRTYVNELGTLAPRARADLAATLEHVGPDVVAYRGWERLLPAVRERLAQG